MAIAISSPQAPSSAPAKSEAIGVLIIDDEEIIHTLGRRILEREGFRVFHASDKVSALHLLEEQGADISLALVDVLMPDIEGPELALLLHAIKPNLKLLFSSGYGVTPEVRVFMDAGQADFIAKPFTRDDILGKIKNVLN